MNRKKGFFLVFVLAYLYEHIRAIDNISDGKTRHIHISIAKAYKCCTQMAWLSHSSLSFTFSITLVVSV